MVRVRVAHIHLPVDTRGEQTSAGLDSELTVTVSQQDISPRYDGMFTRRDQ